MQGRAHRGVRGAAVLAAGIGIAVGLTACGGGGGKAKDKAGWQKDNSALVASYSRDLDDAINNINQGARDKTTGSCTQVSEDGKELRKDALPVPNAAADAALRKAVDTGIQAATDCLAGAREQNQGARTVETAQREFTDARKAMDDAEAAIKAWT